MIFLRAEVLPTYQGSTGTLRPIASFYRVKAAMARHTEANVLPTAGAAKKLV